MIKWNPWTTHALNQRSLRRFGARSCKPAPRAYALISHVASWHTICYRYAVFRSSKVFGFNFHTIIWADEQKSSTPS